MRPDQLTGSNGDRPRNPKVRSGRYSPRVAGTTVPVLSPAASEKESHVKTRRVGSALTGVIMSAAQLLASSSSIAQDATPAVGPSAGGNYPVAIHQGTCEAPTAQPAYEIDDTVPVGANDPDAEILGRPAGAPVLTSSGMIDGSLEDIANGGNVVVIHASPEEFGTITACGQIAGPNADGLTIALQPVGESTTTGIAIFSTDSTGVLGLGEDELRLTVFIVDTSANAPAQPTVATPIVPAGDPEATGTPRV